MSNSTWTKTETLRRLRAAARLVKEGQGFPQNYLAEVGTRTAPVVATAENLADAAWLARHAYYAEGDDLAEISPLTAMASDPQLQVPGVVAHIYITSSGWDGQLESTCCVWLGDADHEPVQLDMDGTLVASA